jgi:hypothetical protein
VITSAYTVRPAKRTARGWMKVRHEAEIPEGWDHCSAGGKLRALCGCVIAYVTRFTPLEVLPGTLVVSCKKCERRLKEQHQPQSAPDNGGEEVNEP